jgi:hypothetical protein
MKYILLRRNTKSELTKQKLSFCGGHEIEFQEIEPGDKNSKTNLAIILIP